MSDNGEIRSTRNSPRVEVPEDVVILVESFGQFLEQHAQDISEDGMFLRSAVPAPVGSHIEFAIRLPDGYPLIRGAGEVVWCRKREVSPESPRGMGIRFVELEERGRELVRRLTEERRETSCSEGHGEGGGEEQEPEQSEPKERGPVEQPPLGPVEHAPLGLVEQEQPEQGALESSPAERIPEEGEPIEETKVAPTQEAAELKDVSEPFGELISKLEAGMSRVQDHDPFVLEPEPDPEVKPEPKDEVFSSIGASEDLSVPDHEVEGNGLHVPEKESPAAKELPQVGQLAGSRDVAQGSLSQSGRRGLWPVAIPVLAVALALLGYGAWQLGCPGGVRAPGPRSPEVLEGPAVTPQRSETTLVQAASGPGATQPAERPEVGAFVATSQTTEPASTSPTPSATTDWRPAPRAPAARASAVTQVTWKRTGTGVQIRIELNGLLDPEAARLSRLDSPPRGLLRIQNIQAQYEPTEISVGVGGLERIRIWLHDEMSPPQLHVVFDLSEARRHLTQEIRDSEVIVTVR